MYSMSERSPLIQLTLTISTVALEKPISRPILTPGVGLYHSTNGGNTWRLLAASQRTGLHAVLGSSRLIRLMHITCVWLE